MSETAVQNEGPANRSVKLEGRWKSFVSWVEGSACSSSRSW